MLVIQQDEYSAFISYDIKLRCQLKSNYICNDQGWKLYNYALIVCQRMALLDRPLGK